jgi:hypothetical protein
MRQTKLNLPKGLLFSALILRLFFSAFFFHPDIKSHHFHAQFLTRGVVDIYAYISANLTRLPYRDTFNYPPLTYYLLGSWNAVSRVVLGPDLISWLNDWGPAGYSHPRMFEFMLVLKLPYLILDFLIGFMLLRFNRRSDTNLLLAGFWFFNPVSLYAIYMLSQFDVICAALTVFALLQTKDRRLFPAALALGLGTMLKSYPLLLLPFVLFRSVNLRQLSTALIGFFLGLLLPLLPVIASPEFYYTMSHSNLMQRVFAAGIEIGGAQKLPIFVIIYALTLWLSWGRKKLTDLLPEFLTVTLSVLLVAHFHAQWAIWSLPFVAVVFARCSPARTWPVFVAAAAGFFLTNILLYDQYAFLGLFSPLNPLAMVFPPLPEMVSGFIDPVLLQSLAHTLLTGSGLWLLYFAWKNYAVE